MDNRDPEKVDDRTEQPQVKRVYRTPQLTEYGSVEDLVDAGVIGSTGTVPSMGPPRA